MRFLASLEMWPQYSAGKVNEPFLICATGNFNTRVGRTRRTHLCVELRSVFVVERREPTQPIRNSEACQCESSIQDVGDDAQTPHVDLWVVGLLAQHLGRCGPLVSEWRACQRSPT
jgi:hypothetical protein